jgi:polysaccharide pyruvyl transferase WcaK-like protein
MPISYLKHLRGRFRVLRQIRAMQRTVFAHPPVAAACRPLRRLLIVPSDPWTLVGAKGDEAMMQSVVQRLRQASAELEVGVITAEPEAEQAARAMGFTPLPAWSVSMADGVRQVEAFGADSMVVVGADVMDGYYSPVTTARMLLTAEAASRFGARVSLLGFSFNASPDGQLKPLFDGLDKSIAVNVRDRISRERFQRFTGRTSRLVADSAFMLQPDLSAASVLKLAQWADGRRAQGDAVIAFNMHPMLIRGATPAQVQALVDSAVIALRQLCQRRAVSVLLLSHDYRGKDGDDVCFRPIASALAVELGSKLMYPTEAFSAAQLKAIAGCTDGVVTGRMHLAIASLGMERPVAALTYQDKFQGLFAHFEYPERFLLSPAGASDPVQLAALMEDFVDQLAVLAAQVRRFLPAAIEASSLNLDVLLTDRQLTVDQASS